MPVRQESSREPAQDAPRRPARDVIDAVLENMRENLEVLKYSTLAPCRYLVYLHATDFARLEGIVPILKEETMRALEEELEKLNHRAVLYRYADRVLRRQPTRVQNAGVAWQVEFLQDPDGPDGDIHPGDILVASELLLPASPELGVGSRTRRITTVHVGQRVTTCQQVVAGPMPKPTVATAAEPADAAPTAVAAASAAVIAVPAAQIVYQDENGRHTFDLTKDSVTIGRGGVAYPVDIRIVSSVDVSREHARIRRDPASGQFFMIDLSSLGTTVNGASAPRGYDEADGSKRENGIEMPLPDRARIGLADTVYLDFEVKR